MKKTTRDIFISRFCTIIRLFFKDTMFANENLKSLVKKILRKIHCELIDEFNASQYSQCFSLVHFLERLFNSPEYWQNNCFKTRTRPKKTSNQDRNRTSRNKRQQLRTIYNWRDEETRKIITAAVVPTH